MPDFILAIISFLGIIGIIASFFIKRKDFIYYVLIFYPFITLAPNLNIIGTFNPIEISSMIILFLAAISFVDMKIRGHILNYKMIWLFILFNLIVFLYSYYSDYTSIESGSEFFFKILLGFLIYFLFSSRLKLADYIKYFHASWIVLLVINIILIIAYLSGIYQVDVTRSVIRFDGLFNDPGTPSYYALFLFVFYTVYTEKLSDKIKGLSVTRLKTAIIWAITFLIMFLTLTKSVIIMFLIFIIGWYGFYKNKKLIIIPLMFLSVYLLYTTNEEINSRFKDEIQFVTGKDSKIEKLGTGRVGRWILLADVYLNQYTTLEQISGTYRAYNAHNNYLAFLMQIGIIGLTMFIVIMYRFYRKISKRYKKLKLPELYVAKLLIIMFLFNAISGHPFYYTILIWYLMLFLSVINTKMQINENKNLPNTHNNEEVKLA